MPDLEITPDTAPSAAPVPYDEEAASRAASKLAMDLADSIDAGCPMSDEEVVARIKAIPGNPAMLQRRKKEGPAWTLKPSEQDMEDETYQAAAKKACDALTKQLGDSIDAGCPLSDEEIVALIKAIPPNPAMIRRRKPKPTESLLYPGERDMPFDEEAWYREWSQIEAEINRLSRD